VLTYIIRLLKKIFIHFKINKTMLKKIILPLSIFATLIAVGCNKTMQASGSAKKEVSESEAYEAFQKAKGDGKTFGEKVTVKDALTYDQMLEKLSKTEKMDNVKVMGTVEAVCKAKGCWMNIKSETDKPSMFVKFKDYAFFMPKDIAGKKVVMIGNAFKETTTVEELRHFAQDEGKSKEEIAKINKPKEEMKFMANGVLILE
jgi:hypothetical protein